MHTFKDLATYCKKKGFMYQSSAIYGGLSGFYDYGHLGTRLKKNFENVWRSYFIGLHENFHEIETAQIMHENVFKASGHLANFVDPIVNCSNCEYSERADHLVEKALDKRVEELTPEELTVLIKDNNLLCPLCKLSFLPVSQLNMMFPVDLGVGTSQRAYLRPETAQSPYVNFKLQYELLRKKLPMGLALIGRAFRNEISPRNFILRQRAFTQAELQIFFNPHTIDEHPDFESVREYELRIMLVEDRMHKMVVERSAQKMVEQGLPQMHVYHLVKIQQFYVDVLQIPRDRFRLYQLNDKEKAFYNKYHFDIEVDLQEHGFTEVGGLHYRTDHDLKGHQEISTESMVVLDEASGEKFIPHVLELSMGVDRSLYSVLDVHYELNAKRGNDVLHVPASFAPFMCAVFPLVKNKENIVAKAREVYEMVRKDVSCMYDHTSSVGRRYARADEIGVKYCITIDFESLEDNCVTIRDRDSMNQKRVRIEDVKEHLRL